LLGPQPCPVGGTAPHGRGRDRVQFYTVAKKGPDIAVHSAINARSDPRTIVVMPKLEAPAPRPEQLVRPRLLELLKAASDCRLTLVSAAAGYGKTTLLSQWHREVEGSLPFAWVSLDEQDNDPVRLWRHVVEAVRRVVPEEDFGADVLVGMSVPGQGLVEMALPMLINELAELPPQIVIALDDFQAVTEGDCHDSVAYFVDHLPANVHLVLASRSDPPLALGRLRARGELSEIRTQDLAFSEEETARLLKERLGLGVETTDLLVLHERTEGWPAAIYLAALSLQNREDSHAFIASFGGSSRYIVDLLGEEVLASLPEEVREFLLMTSVLRRMTGALCDAVVGREGSGNLLRELARSNLFVVPLEGQDHFYRFHHLFSDLLLYELRSSQPELVPVLHSRASVWLEDAGYFESAVKHAIAAEDHERVGILIARHWFEYVFAGQTATVEWALGVLPEDVITADATLVLVKAWISALYGRREERDHYMTLAEVSSYEGPLPDRTSSVESGVATIRAVFAYGGVQSTLEAARQAAALDPALTSPWAGLIRLGLGHGLYLSGDSSGARKPLEEALVLTRVDKPLVRMAVLFSLSNVALDEGRLEEAEARAREARELVERFQLHRVPQATLVPIALGRVLAERGELEEAQEELEYAHSSRRRLSPDLSPWPTLIGLLALASVRAACGSRGAAQAVLAEARTILDPFSDDAGIFPEFLERQERTLLTIKRRNGSLNGKLTERELDVLRLLVGDLSTRQMAHGLYLAPNTVRTHIKSIYRKLEVSSRKEAVEEAYSRKLI
jgi:LuxR family transcriptional regulator, maltose regulon positive regulatory protein